MKRAGSNGHPRPASALDVPAVAASGGDDGGDPRHLPFPVVGIGASAGGLDAFTKLLQALPADTGMAFVLVQHLAAKRASMLAEILGRATAMPVAEVNDETTVGANRVYVIPPGQEMVIAGGVLALFPRREAAGQHCPIDTFFTSLAADQGHQAIGVVLSGTASDGTVGLQEIKAAGGITFAQDTSARQGDMPESAIASGCVDVVLPPDGIARELARIARHPYIAPSDGGPEETGADAADLSAILQVLRDSTAVDFTQYKVTTLSRRIERRMLLHKQADLRDYAKFLQRTPGEVEALYQDILIGVTSFFRDPEVFAALERDVLPKLLGERERQEPVRIWVLGCSTGEEAYSIAMAFTECEEAAGIHVPLQIFATDLNTTGLATARAGFYPKSIAGNMSEARLRRFFVESDDGYRVSQAIRDCCLFTHHNVLADPPFSRVDMITCRNVLIYLDTGLQRQILPLLHYALKPGGVLLLGHSETIGAFHDLFEVRDAAHHIYVRRPGAARHGMQFPQGRRNVAPASHTQMAAGHSVDDILKQADRFVLENHAPPGVVVNAELELLHIRGDVSPYLMLAEGPATISIAKLVRPDVLVPLLGALRRAKEEDAVVREAGLRLQGNGSLHEMTVEVAPLRAPAGGSNGFAILFLDAGLDAQTPAAAAVAVPSAASLGGDVDRLTRELAASRRYLESVIEQQETANQELQASNEEVQSANEELQSINEELETSKEEIQSSNEELATVNDELQSRNAELGRFTEDLTNLIASIEMSVVIVTRELCIRRFSPMAAQALSLRESDIGRPITDLQLDIGLGDLQRLLREVIEAGAPIEREVQHGQGRWFSLRIRPYRTLANTIAGAIVVLVDVDALKRAHAYAESIVDTVREPLVILDGGLRVVSANAAFYETFQVSGGETTRRSIYDLGEGQWDLPQLRMLLAAVLPQHRVLSDFEVTHEFPKIGRRVMLLNARPILHVQRGDERLLLAIEDITERRGLEDELRRSFLDLAEVDRRKNEFLAMLAHELRNPLAPIRNATRLLQMDDLNEDQRGTATQMIERQVGHMVRLVDDLLDVSRVALGTITLRRAQVDLAALLIEVVEAAQAGCDAAGQTLTMTLPDDALYLNADPTRVTQIVNNLLVNACKFSVGPGQIDLSLEREGRDAVIRVRDSGIGIDAAALPRIFDMFVQLATPPAQSVGGLGIGLTLVKRMVELHGGTVHAHSSGLGHGSEFVIRLPSAIPLPVAAAGGDPIEKGAAARRRILVVDDNRDAAESLAMLLEIQGHEVVVVHAGGAAVDMTARMQPDVVFLDLGLPGIDGYEAARQIRIAPGGRGVRLVALTGWGRDEDRERTAQSGFDAHLVKPVDCDLLTELVRSSPSRPRDSSP